MASRSIYIYGFITSFFYSQSELEISAKAVRIVVIGYLIPQFLISGKQSSWPLENAMASAKI